jgi:hypothetical protein
VQVFVQLVSRVMQIPFIYDVVPFENAPGLVTAYEHGHLFRDPSAYKIPDAGSPQVVEKPFNTGCPYGLLPSLSDVHYLMATPCGFAAWVHAALPEKDPWGIRAQGLVTLLLVRQHVMQVIAGPAQRNDTRFSGLGLVITQAHSPSF